MKYSFTFYNPTRVHFGSDSLEHLSDELSRFGQNVLMVYGFGSIKKIGLYNKVMDILSASGKNVFEVSEVTPNPRWEKVVEGAELCREHDIDLILAVGGGSVIDCAKGIALAAHASGDAWTRFWINDEQPTHRVLPLGTILTMVGTGSEMNGGSVITNGLIKTDMNYQQTHPTFSILNPEYTYSLSRFQMLSGVFDILSHIMEQYFCEDDEDNLSDDLAETIFKSVVRSCRAAIKNPTDYTARSNLMWGATVALNGLLSLSKRGDWEVHQIEHQLGAYYDIAHGMGLAVISPAYYRRICKYAPKRFARFAQNVWDIKRQGRTDEQLALLGVNALAAFIIECGMTPTLRKLGITDNTRLKEIAESCYRLGGGYHKLSCEEIFEILEESF